MSHLKLQPQPAPPSLTIAYCGEYFLPVEVLKTRLQDEMNLELMRVRKSQDLVRLVLPHARGMVIVFHESPEDTPELQSLFKTYSAGLQSGRVQLFIIAHRNLHKLKLKYKTVSAVTFFPSTVQVPELFGVIRGPLKTMVAAVQAETGGGLSGIGGKVASVPPPGLSANDRDSFRLVSDASALDDTFIDAVRGKVPLSMFSEDLQTSFKLNPKKYDPISKALRAEFQTPPPDSALEKLKAGAVFFANINLKRGRAFLKANQFEVSSTGDLTLFITEPLFQVQRRAFARLPISPGSFVSLRTGAGDWIAQGEILDMSAGGLALAVDGETTRELKAGMVLGDLRFLIVAREIIIPEATIRHVMRMPNNPKVLKVGIEFNSMKPSDKSFVNMYVYRESLKHDG
jgi:hypothetical protein